MKVTFRQMLGDLCTLDSLAAFLDEKMPPEVLTHPDAEPAPVSAAKASSEDAVAAVPVATAVPVQIAIVKRPEVWLETVIQQQMAIMAQQLDLLRQAGATGVAMPATASPDVPSGHSVQHAGRYCCEPGKA